jgi:ribosomal-protein-alanine N-acetyltransferase
VADLDGEIVAYGVVAMGAGEAHILNLCVRGDLRGRSIGRQMLALLLERSRQAGVESVFLEVRPTNPHAIALYQSVGFVQVGLRKAYYQAEGGREDALVLKLDLDRGGDLPPA